MPRPQHYDGEDHLHYLTANIYRCARIFDSDRFRLKFTRTLNDLRAELGFRIIGYVLMPEHCHLLIWPCDLADPSGDGQNAVSDCGGAYINANDAPPVEHPGAI
ncbi:MAG TPA: hypothetical protein VMX16_14315 [Terriglobia bacterium]|nr:hypothetical protein [Terriglobia bacterium]